jgi:hypothetical protein
MSLPWEEKGTDFVDMLIHVSTASHYDSDDQECCVIPSKAKVVT